MQARIDGGAGVDTDTSVNWRDLETAVVLDLNDPEGVTIGSGDTQRYLRGIEALSQFGRGSGDDVITFNPAARLRASIETGAGNNVVKVFGGATGALIGIVEIRMNTGVSDGADQVISDFNAATSKFCCARISPCGCQLCRGLQPQLQSRSTF